MKSFILSAILLTVTFFLPVHNLKPDQNSGQSRFANDHIIVKLKMNRVLAASNTTNNYENTLNELFSNRNIQINKIKKLYPEDKKHNTNLYSKYELESYYIVYFKDKPVTKELCDDLSKDLRVDFSEPDFIGESAGVKGLSLEPNDTFFGRQWGLKNDGTQNTTTGRKGKANADMNVLKAWDIATGSSDIIVGIMDSGTKIDHPDLEGRIWVNTEEVKNGRDDDGNGFVDDINGFNFAYDNPNVKDDGGHGTNIAGTIGASTNNNMGYAGIDQKCKLMVCKNLDSENLGEYSWWSASLYYAANNGARILNMSEGGYDYSKTLENAVNYAYDAGCLIVASMMNKNNGDTYYPASFKNVLAVGATDTDDSRCREFTWGGGSNWGKHIAVVAPGNKIYGLDYKDNQNFDVYWSGTSQATAYVSGIASVLLGQDPSRTNKELREIITQTAVDQVGDPREDKAGWDEYYGYGRVDLYEALNYNKYSSGKKEEKRTEEKKEVDDRIYEKDIDNSNGNSTRAKANEETESYKDKKDDRAKKPKADDR